MPQPRDILEAGRAERISSAEVFERRGRWQTNATVLLAQTASVGCAPTVDVLGVYFPGWLVSTITGVASAYVLVYWLGRRSGTRPLAESGVFFVSLTVGIALVVWLLFFSGF